jgi:hypothetical protein
MIIITALLLFYGGWPLMAFFYYRICKRAPVGRAISDSVAALAIGFFLGPRLRIHALWQSTVTRIQSVITSVGSLPSHGPVART